MATETKPLRDVCFPNTEVEELIAKAWLPAPLAPHSILTGVLLWSRPPIPNPQLCIVLGACIINVAIALGVFCPIFVHASYMPPDGCDQPNWPEPEERGTIAYTFRLCGPNGDIALQFLTQLQMLGAGFGVLVGGYMSDSVGRYKTLWLTGVVTSFSLFLSALSPAYAVYACSRFLTGAGAMAMSIPAYAMTCEWLPKAWQVPVCVALISTVAFAVGQLLLVGLGFHFRAWQDLLTAVAILHAFLTLLCLWMVRESPVWLSTQPGGKQEMLCLLGRGTPPDKPLALQGDAKNTPASNDMAIPKKAFGAIAVPHADWVYRRSVTWAMAFMWLVVSLTYYGISLAIAEIGGNLYRDATLSALSEIPAAFIVAYLLETPALGRRFSHSVLFTLGGLGCLLLPHAPGIVGRLFCMFVGKLSLTAAFNGVYGYTSELYTPGCRGKGMATCSAMARVGSLIAPLITKRLAIGHVYSIFGYLTLIAAFLCWAVLPETRLDVPPESKEPIRGETAKGWRPRYGV